MRRNLSFIGLIIFVIGAIIFSGLTVWLCMSGEVMVVYLLIATAAVMFGGFYASVFTGYFDSAMHHQ